MTTPTTGPTRIGSSPEIKNHIGVPLGPSEWVLVDQARINAFAEATGDRQWIHIDVERAREESPFGQTIGHGYLTLALIPSLIPQILHVENCSMVVNYGTDRIRLPAPVISGSRIRLAAEFKAVRELPNGAARAVLTFRFDLENGAKPVCTGDVVYVYYP